MKTEPSIFEIFVCVFICGCTIEAFMSHWSDSISAFFICLFNLVGYHLVLAMLLFEKWDDWKSFGGD
jgi:hypothetical protein